MTSSPAKKLSRLIAVQALYQIGYGEESSEDILRRVTQDPMALLNDEGMDGQAITEKPDTVLCAQIIRGVQEHAPALEEMLGGALGEKKSPARLEALLRHIFLAGIYELYHHSDIDAPIIVNDYVDVAHAFFQGKEPGLVNAVLDKLAKMLRK